MKDVDFLPQRDSIHSVTEVMYILSATSFCSHQVKAVYFNNTPIPDKLVFLLEGEKWSALLLQNLTTDSNGIATFSLSTTNYTRNMQLRVSQ